MKHIAIALHAGTPPLRNSLTEHLVAKKISFWHWIDDFWILEVESETTPKQFYKSLVEADALDPKSTVLLFELEGRLSYWGKADKAAWEWLSSIGYRSP